MASNADRAATRFVVSFMIDFAKAAADLTGSYDLGLLFFLVELANVDSLPNDAAFEWEHADAPVPDRLRRPVSANAIALELNLPRETVRRQINQLLAKGFLQRVDRRGVIVPTACAHMPAVVKAQEAMLESFGRMVGRIVDAGFEWPVCETSRRLSTNHVPTFLVLRQVLALAVRLFNLSIAVHGRLESAVLMHAVTEYNLRALTDDPVLSRAHASTASSAPADSLREPVSTRSLAARTGIPRATLQRIISRKIELSELVRAPGGVIAPAYLFDEEPRLSAMRVGYGYLRATMARLSALGVSADSLRNWDAGRWSRSEAAAALAGAPRLKGGAAS
jgi:hypothetical protein